MKLSRRDQIPLYGSRNLVCSGIPMSDQETPPTETDSAKTNAGLPFQDQVIRLSSEEIASLLPRLRGWELHPNGKRIVRRCRTRDFASAMALLARIGHLAEGVGHHPDLHLESYCHVRIELWTHAVEGLTHLDFQLAAKIDELLVNVTDP